MNRIILLLIFSILASLNSSGQQSFVTSKKSIAYSQKAGIHKKKKPVDLKTKQPKAKSKEIENQDNHAKFLPPPANNSACNAIMVTVNSGPVAGTNLLATVQNNEVVPPSGTSCTAADGWCEIPVTVDNSVWYKFIVPAGGAVIISTCGAANSFDTQLALWDPVTCGSFGSYTFIGANDDGNNCTTNFTSVLPVAGLTPGDTLWIQVDGFGGDEGTFELEIKPLIVPANDLPCNATPVIVGSGAATYTLINALVDSNENSIVPTIDDCATGWCELTNSIDNSVWFTFTAPPSGAVSISTCNSIIPFDTQLALYEVGSCNDYSTYSLFAANDDGDTAVCPSALLDYTSYLSVCGLSAGNTYYLLVDGFDGASGDFELEINQLNTFPPSAAAGNSTAPTCINGLNGTAEIVVSGGIPPYQYLWSNGYKGSNLIASSGNYTVIVTEQCGLSDTLNVTIPPGTTGNLSVTTGNTLHICDSTAKILTASVNGGLTADTSINFIGYNLINGDLLKIKGYDPSNPVIITANNPENYYAGDFTPSGFYAIDDNNSTLVQIEVVTGISAVIGKLDIDPGHNWTGMTWNDANNTLYALSSNGVNCTLYAVDYVNATSTVVANITGIGIGIWLAASPGGTLYTMDIISDSLYTIDKATGLTTPVGYIGFNANYAQGADFDLISGKLFAAAYNFTTNSGELYTLDTLTGSSTFIGTLPGEIDAFACLPYTAGDLYSYNWSPAGGLSATDVANPTANPATTTTYTVIVTDACGTTTSSTQEVTVSNISLNVTNTDVSVFGGNDGTADVNPSGGTTPYLYSWNNGASTASISNLSAGTYTVTVNDANGCSQTATVVIMQPAAAINEIGNAGFSHLEISPNPTTGKISIDAGFKESTLLTISILDLNGKLIQSSVESSGVKIKKSIDLKPFGKGIYSIQFTTKKGTYNHKIIVQ